MPQALKPLCLIHIGSCKNFPFPFLALWGNKNGKRRLNVTDTFRSEFARIILRFSQPPNLKIWWLSESHSNSCGNPGGYGIRKIFEYKQTDENDGTGGGDTDQFTTHGDKCSDFDRMA